MRQPGSALGSVSFWTSRFEKAQRATAGVVTYDLPIGPCRIRFRLAGPALLAGLMAGFERSLESPSLDQPTFSIDLWDYASTGIGLEYSQNEVPGQFPVEDGDPPMSVRHDPITGVLRALSPGGERAWWTVPDASRLHYYCRTTPLREYLPVALRRAGLAFLHAGAVGTPEGGVLLVGAGGSGKSTATMACFDSGVGTVSEDFTALQPGPAPVARSIYSTAKLNDDSLAWLPRLTPHLVNPHHAPGEKNLIYLHRIRTGLLLDQVPLKAVLAVSRSPTADTSIVTTCRADVLRAMAPSTILPRKASGELHDGAIELAEHARLLRQLPCFRLLTGRHLHEIPAAICGLLQSL